MAESPPQRLAVVRSALASVAEDLSLDTLLERIVVQAAELSEARIGVFDVVHDSFDSRLGGFAAVGVEPSADQPTGRSLLVDLMARSEPVHHGLPFVGVPVLVDGEVFGNLYLLDKQHGELTVDDEQLIGVFASAAGTIISAALARATVERDRRWLEATTDIASTLLGPVSYEAAWQLVVDRAVDVSSASCAMLLLTRGTGDLYVEAVAGIPAGGVLGSRVGLFGTLIGDAAQSGAVLVVPHTALEPQYDPNLTARWPDLTAMQVLPLRDGGSPGALVVGWYPDNPVTDTALDPELPQRFVEQAALVLEMAHVRDDQRRLAVLEDRARISRDIHDVVIQRLFAIGMTLDQAARGVDDETADTVRTAVDGLDETIQDLRRTIFGLSSGDADDPDVGVVIQRLVDDAADLLRFRPTLTISGPVTTQVSGDVRQNVVAVAGEMLSNVVQHAGATRVAIDLAVDDDVVLTITDDGRGMEARDPFGSGNGLRNIARRAELLDGRCEVRTAPGEGTMIKWTVPGGTA